MALVGDIIMAGRELAPDAPGVLPPPSGLSVASSVVASCTLPVSTDYRVKLSFRNAWGETTCQTESGAIVVDATHGILISGSLPVGVTAVRAYFGTGAGGENQYTESATLPFTIIAPGTAGNAPTRNSAWNPDSDGGFVATATIYRWLNEGLKRAAKLVGGIEDYSALQALTNTNRYNLNGQWLRLTNCWFDGLPVVLGSAWDNYRKNQVTGVTGFVSISANTNLTTVEFWPEPSRQGSTTTLNGGISATAASAVVTDVTGLLPLGMIQVDSEMISYGGIVGNTLVGLQRGMGGTSAASHLTAAGVTELNIQFKGFRMPSVYSVGDSTKVIAIPPAWESLLPTYILSRYRRAEQDEQSASLLLKEFEGEIMAASRANRVIAGPMQLGDGGANRETAFGSLGGGWFIP